MGSMQDRIMNVLEDGVPRTVPQITNEIWPELKKKNPWGWSAARGNVYNALTKLEKYKIVERRDRILGSIYWAVL